MLARYLAVLSLIAPLVFGDVQFTSPAAGASLTGTKITIAWKDSGDAPPLSQLQTYSIYLYGGGNTAGTYQQIGAPIVAGKTFAAGSTASGTIDITTGEAIKNAYFLAIVSTPSSGAGTVTNYSPRFSLPNMSGKFPAAIKVAAQGVTGTTGPDTVNAIAAAGQNNAVDAPVGSYGVPYQDQDGATKYAPMQRQPGTKITAKTPTPLYPTSSVSFFKSNMPPPKQKTTQTMSKTFSVNSVENQATPAPHPNDPMQRFLNRWKD